MMKPSVVSFSYYAFLVCACVCVLVCIFFFATTSYVSKAYLTFFFFHLLLTHDLPNHQNNYNHCILLLMMLNITILQFLQKKKIECCLSLQLQIDFHCNLILCVNANFSMDMVKRPKWQDGKRCYLRTKEKQKTEL